MEITDSACVPTFSFPFALDCQKYYELMVAQGEGRSPMTSSDAETDSKPIIIIIIMANTQSRTSKSKVNPYHLNPNFNANFISTFQMAIRSEN